MDNVKKTNNCTHKLQYILYEMLSHTLKTSSKWFYIKEMCEMRFLTLVLCSYVYCEPSYHKVYKHLLFLYLGHAVA
jgi:hypothetical protein